MKSGVQGERKKRKDVYRQKLTVIKRLCTQLQQKKVVKSRFQFQRKQVLVRLKTLHPLQFLKLPKLLQVPQKIEARQIGTLKAYL
jgi:hypothetical protein